MRPFLLLVLLAMTVSLPGLGRLVQPDGTSVALAEEVSSGVVTLLFSPRSVASRSWLTLPRGSLVTEVTLAGPGYRRVVEFPTVAIPGVRFAVEMTAPVLAVTLKGRLGSGRTLVRTLERPGNAGEAWVTRSAGTLRINLPAWKVATDFTPTLTLTRPTTAPWSATLSNATTSRTFSFQASVRRWDFAPSAWGFVPTRLEVTGKDPRLAEVRVRAWGADTPLPADPQTLLAWPSAQWRVPQREWFGWAGTSILVLVTDDYGTQDDYLKRLAFYVEKTGYRGRLVPDEELAPLHGWNAHDYAAPDLARFFTQAVREGFPLNRAEVELRARLTSAGILVAKGEGVWEAGTGALVGISQASPPALRAVLFTHEAFHGLYFTNPAFRAGVATAWNSLSDEARGAFRSFLALSRYDPADEGLMVNEFQAYVLQRTPRDWSAFFRSRVLASRGDSPAALTWLAEYLGAAQALDSLVERLFGVRSGDVSSVTTP